MGLLTEAFIASEADVTATHFAGSGPGGLFPTVPAQRVDDLKLAALDALVTGQNVVAPEQDPEASVRGIEERFVLVRNLGTEAGNETQGPWISRFPDSLVARLAQLTPAEVARYGAAWANADEWRFEDPSMPEKIADIQRLFQEYCRLAAQAQAEGKHLYMWMSL
jgi:hypothetical protein